MPKRSILWVDWRLIHPHFCRTVSKTHPNRSIIPRNASIEMLNDIASPKPLQICPNKPPNSKRLAFPDPVQFDFTECYDND
jgi:hypothetical protein